jgi:hypothetical protein
MRLQRELQDRRQRDDEAEEEDDRERVSHSFSPDLSTAKFPRRHLAPWMKTLFPFCSLVKALQASNSRPFGGTVEEQRESRAERRA